MGLSRLFERTPAAEILDRAEVEMLFHSRSAKRGKTLSRRFTRMPSRCHALNRRVAVNTETSGSFANSSFPDAAVRAMSQNSPQRAPGRRQVKGYAKLSTLTSISVLFIIV